MLSFWSNHNFYTFEKMLTPFNKTFLTDLKWNHLQMINIYSKVRFICDGIENVVRKGESAIYQHFLLPQFFTTQSRLLTTL